MNPMTPSNDLLDTVAQNRWRLDCRYESGLYRVMYYCVECGLWRCVEELGAYHATPRAAIEAAVRKNGEAKKP